MDHEQVRERLSDYIEGELSEQERAAVEKHLETCQACRAEADALAQTLSLLSSLSPVQAPEGFASSVRHKMRRRGRRNRRVGLTLGLRQKVPFETIALVMLLIILAIYLMLFVFKTDEADFLPSRPQPPTTPKIQPDGPSRPHPSSRP